MAVSALVQLLLRSAKRKLYRGGWAWEYFRTHQPLDLINLNKTSPVDVIVAIVDHFEPGGKHGDRAAGAVVKQWRDNYAQIVDGHVDADGVCPQHTWFYRFEYLNPYCVEQLSLAVFEGLGEVEFHLHHGHDDHASFSEKLTAGLRLARQYGAMLTAEKQPQSRFAYVAGNWSLDNGAGNPSLSGCNTELSALREVGCYADFTFPAIGSKAQPRKSNSIYYATDCPKPKSYNNGKDVRVDGSPCGDLMIVQGPTLVDFQRGYIDTGAIETYAEPKAHRLANWLRANVHVAGRPEWLFVKLHTHGMQSEDAWFGERFRQMFDNMEQQWKRPPFRLHYVTAREMFNIIKAAEAGLCGNPHQFRSFDVQQPFNRLVYCSRPMNCVSFDKGLLDIEMIESGTHMVRFAFGPIKSITGKMQRVQMRCDGDDVSELRIYADGEIKIDSVSPVDVPCKIISPTSGCTSTHRF